MLLESRVPEILRVVLLAGSKVNVGRCIVSRKCQRKGHLDRRSIRPFALALETQGRRREDSGGPILVFIAGSVFGLKDEKRKALPPCQEVAIVSAEERGEPVVAELVRFRHR